MKPRGFRTTMTALHKECGFGEEACRLRHGVSCWPGIVMALYWLILAWGHSHDEG
jgi:hypothetical protein